MTERDTRGACRALTVLLALGAMLLCATAAEASTIHACVRPHSGATRIVGAKTKCHHGEQKLTWNSEGPRGPAGPNGANGAGGLPGAPGSNGAGPLFSGIGGIFTIETAGTVVASKAVPPGSYMVWAKTNLAASGKAAHVELLSCELAWEPGTTGSGEPKVLDVTFAYMALGDFGSEDFLAASGVVMQAPLTTSVTATLTVKCFKPEGNTASDSAEGTQLQALGVTSVS